MKNLFIALEGIDGSGKSTQTKRLCDKLTEAGHKVYRTFEPTDGMVGSLIRNILKGNMKADERTIAGLFVADRLDHLLHEATGIVKKLEEGFTVVTDRYYFSSYAYHGTHMDMDWVIQSNAMSANILRPDLNIFIDVSPENCMERISANRESVELYETMDNLRNVHTKYMEAFEKLKHEEKVAFVDGIGSLEEVAEKVWEQVQSL